MRFCCCVCYLFISHDCNWANLLWTDDFSGGGFLGSCLLKMAKHMWIHCSFRCFSIWSQTIHNRIPSWYISFHCLSHLQAEQQCYVSAEGWSQSRGTVVRIRLLICVLRSRRLSDNQPGHKDNISHQCSFVLWDHVYLHWAAIVPSMYRRVDGDEDWGDC